MLKCEQEFMRLKTYEKKATQNKHVKVETKQTRIWGFWVTASRTLEQVNVRMSSACVCRLDHAYVDPYPKNLINTKIEQKQKKNKQKTKNINLAA